MVKLSWESNWYHMHVEVSRTLPALEICAMCHTWLCDLVILCIGEIWWIIWNCGLVNYVTWWFNLMTFISVIVMKCESYVFDLMISLVMMIALPILLQWWIVFVELIRQELMWSIWLMWIRWIICIMWCICLCKMSEVACTCILSKWESWCSWMIKLNKEWGDKSLYRLMLLR